MVIKKHITRFSYSVSLLVQILLAIAAVARPATAQTPVGYWKFGEGSGTQAIDSSGYGHTAALVNGVRWVTRKVGNGVSANAGERQYVSIPAIDLSDTQAVTVAFWVNRNYTTEAGSVLLEAGTNYQNSPTSFALLPDDETCHGIRAALRGNEGTTANCYGQPSSGVWHHLAVVYDKSQTGGDQVLLYVDGVQQNPNWNLSSATNTNNFGNDPVYLFSRAGSSQFSSGTVKDLRIYNSALTAAQVEQIYNGFQLGSASLGGSIALDGNVHGVQDNGFTSNNTAVVSIGTPTAGDLITCEVTFDSGNGNTLVSVTDNANGAYTAAVPIYLDSNLAQWFGVYYRQNVAGSATTVTLTTSQSRPYEAISCQAWKGVAISNPLDSGFVQWQNEVGIPNPTTGSNKAPAANGELVIAAAALYNSGTPTAGTNYNLIDGASTTRWWPEYWIQTTATPTAGNYTWPSDTWADMMAAFRPAAAGSFTITASPASLSVAQGNQGTSTITTAISNGFNSSIALSASGMPSGTTVTFNPTSIPAPGSGSSTMSITVGSSTPTGTYPITVTGNGGGIRQTATVTLTVTAAASFTISASPASLSVAQGNQGTSTITTAISNGFNSSIALSASGMPSGTTVTFNPTSIPAPGSGSSTMSITVGSSTPTGTYPITVTGNGGGIRQTATVTLTVTAAASFTISASPASLSVAQGNQGTSTITTAISNGFNSSIALSASGMPSGTTVTFNPTSIPAPGSGSSTMSITVGSSTPTGTYPITVTGNGGGIRQTATVTLTVTAAASFTISASPASLSVAQGNQGTSTITTAISNGFNSSIALSASGMPSGTTVTFNPTSIPAPGSGSSTMSITVGSSTPTGTYPITVTGNGGGIRQTATVTLTVTAAASFTISASPASLSVAQGNQGTSTITTAISNGFNSSIALSASGMPSGTTVTFNPTSIPAPGSGSSTMSITVGSSTPTGTYPITVTGSGGGLQEPTTITLTVTGTGIALDGNVHGVQDNGFTSNNTAVVSIGTPTAGDLITCEVTFDSGNGNTLVSVTDNANGAYTAAVPIYLDSNLAQWFGVYYRQNVAGSATTVTLTTSQSRPYEAISCQAWKGVAISNPLDSGFVQWQNEVGIPNPTTGSNKAPAANGELVIAAAALYNSGTPTAGTNYNLIDGASTTRWWPEYWIQTTATPTAGNYTWPSDTWADMMAAFRPAAAGSFTITASPASLSVAQGNQGTSTITTAISNGFNSSIALSASGMPSGTTVTFNPTSIPAPGSGSSTMSITVGSSTPTGTYPITVTGNGGGIRQTATVTLTVTAAASFTISASPASLSVAQGNQGTSTITAAVSGGFNSAISLSASGMPSGTTVSFNPQTIPAPGSGNSTMTITVGASTPTGTYPITVTGNGGGTQQTATVILTVTAQGQPNFTISASPASLTIMQGNQGSSTISTAISGGFNSSISLSASGLPVGTTVSFNPNTIPAPGSGSSTMTITVGSNTPMGTYPITVAGNGGGTQQTVTVTLTVTAQVILTWTASTSPGIAGYNAYRSTTSGGPYTQLNSSLISTTTYNDLAVQNGYTYYYVTTAVNNQGMQSGYSNESSATVP